MNSSKIRLHLINGRVGILVLLVIALVITRFHHEGTPFVLPDASLAVFFLAGLFFKGSAKVFLSLLTLAFAIDILAIYALGVSDYCWSPAYMFLVPTYAVMWLGGVILQQKSHASLSSRIVMLTGLIALSTSLAFLISNGSFFWFSGKVGSVSLLDYAKGLAEGYLPYIGSTAVYVVFGLGMKALLSNLLDIRSNQSVRP
jgi:hypothetical protein